MIRLCGTTKTRPRREVAQEAARTAAVQRLVALRNRFDLSQLEAGIA